MLCAPRCVNKKQFAVNEKMWYSGSAVMMTGRPHGRHRRLDPGGRLQQIRHHVSMRQHRAFATPVVPPVYCRNAASCGVTFDRRELEPQARRQRTLEAQCARYVPRRHLLANVAQHEVHDRSARKSQQIADARQYDLFDVRRGNTDSQHVREVLEDYDRLRAGVRQLMLEFARRVQRIGIDDDHARPQGAEQRYRILEDVRHHEAMRSPRARPDLCCSHAANARLNSSSCA
jgi:hypothetical protein